MTDTAPNTSDRDTRRMFVNGGKGGPGRPKGSRNRLSEDFLSDLANEWERSGPLALQRVATMEPATFVRVVASLMPRQFDASLDVAIGIDPAQARLFAQSFRLALDVLGAEPEGDDPPLIEAEAEDAED
jgi:hypothetical protein